MAGPNGPERAAMALAETVTATIAAKVSTHFYASHVYASHGPKGTGHFNPNAVMPNA
jgi:hypothetical protein